MERIEVSTKEQLKKAFESKPEEIIVTGKLAGDLVKTKKIAKIGGAGLVALLALTTISPPAGIAAVAALTGTEIAIIIIAVSIGVALIIAIFKEYEVIEISNGVLRLRKKQ